MRNDEKTCVLILILARKVQYTHRYAYFTTVQQSRTGEVKDEMKINFGMGWDEISKVLGWDGMKF